MPIQAVNSKEPIAGYKVGERIGAGGYGEVWTADAPGGLKKAIKFVYGYLDEDRASRELKALNRIKEVRHPFLLSLERIEVVDGQLLIVTELAESSLKDRFDECKREGLDGIPRDELLVYLRDTADALDFMSESHSLQHLDVKPENLLLVGGRIKVADFGLVKHLHEATASLMGGLTPLYAPPEVFDGRPSLHSDQYSLAIVYQEMLTGVLPFPGTSAAQLASQHLHAKPRISSLPVQDQPVIEHALNKDPNDRFEKCGDLVDALATPQDAPAETANARSAQSKRDSSKSGAAATAAFTSIGTSAAAKKQSQRLIPAVQSTPQVRNGARVELAAEQICLRPTLIIGLGGTAAHVLSNLNKRLHDRVGDRKRFAALQMLLVDTNSKSLIEATQGDESHGIAPEEVLAMPLRRPKEYRNRAKKFGQSTSRRWLYNVPKSLQTEGLRPLGRLAWLDHYEDLYARLHQCLTAAMDPDTIRNSSEVIGLRFREDRPHVVIVSSIAGGTGSGMFLDTAYTVRHVLNELEIDDADVCGLLTHSTGRNPTANDLAVANAYASLCELQHYGRPDRKYPGESACRIPPFEHEQNPFDSTYLLHFGNELTDQQFVQQTDQLAEYLYQDSVTSAATLLDQCRSQRSDNAGSQLRSFGIYQVGMSKDDFLNQGSRMVSQALVQRWLGEAGNEDARTSTAPGTTCSLALARTNEKQNDECINRLATEFLDQAGVRCDAIMSDVQEIIQQHIGSDLHRQLETLLENVASSNESDQPHQDVLQGIDIALGHLDDEGDARNATVTALPPEVVYHLDQMAEGLANKTNAWLLKLLDESSHHLSDARQAAKWLESVTDSRRSETIQVEGCLDNDLQQLHVQIKQFDQPEPVKTKAKKGIPETRPSLTPESQLQLTKYLNLGVHRLALRGTRKIILTLQTRIGELSERLRECWRELHRMDASLDTTDTTNQSYCPTDEEEAHNPTLILTERLRRRLPELADKLDKQLRADAGEAMLLSSFLSAKPSMLESFPDTMRQAARKLIMSSQAGDDIIELLIPKNMAPETVLQRLKESVELASPELLECGGTKRILLLVPEGVDTQAPQMIIEKGLNECVSVAANNVSEIVLCCEVEEISLAQVAVNLIDNRIDYAEVASRLYSRSDVTWRPWG